MEVVFAKDRSTLEEKFATDLASYIRNEVGSGREVVLYLSGGSAVNCYDKLADALEAAGDVGAYRGKLTLRIVDDRVFPNDSGENPDANALKIRTTKLPALIEKLEGEVQFLSNDYETIKSELQDYSSSLAESFADKNQTHIAVLGIGEDLHTAGILPSEDSATWSQRFLSGDSLVSLYEAPDFPYRQTYTVPALKKMSALFIWMTDKPETLARLLELGYAETKLHKYPASLLNSTQNTRLYTNTHTTTPKLDI